MPAQSKSQQRFFGVVKAMQKGDIPKKGKAGKIAKSMSKDDVDDFASTKHKGKPEKVKREQRVRNLIKKMVREELNKMNENSDTFVNILNKFGFKKGARDWGGHQFFVHKSKNLYATYNPNGRSLVIEPKRGGKALFDSDRSNFSIRALLSYLQSPKNKFVSTEGTCGYGENGELGEEPAGPHLIKKIKEGKDTIFDVAKKVMKDKQHQNYKSKKGMVKLDMQSANLLMKLYNAVKDKDKEKMNKMNERKLIMVLNKLWSRVKLKLPT